MFRRWLREYYMLGRGEQRALLLLALILMLSLMIRVTVQFLPGRTPPGMDEFMKENREIITAFEQQDSLEKLKHRRREPEPVDINRVDSSQLLRLPGIGPVFSGRIIKYRNLLGGYSALHQLREVYGLSPETVEKIGSSILVDTSAIQPLNMNGASFSDLLRHPYLNYNDVKALVQYRDFKGRIRSAKEIRGNHLLNDSTLERMIPYLDFDH